MHEDKKAKKIMDKLAAKKAALEKKQSREDSSHAPSRTVDEKPVKSDGSPE
jgi:hypothetical protein